MDEPVEIELKLDFDPADRDRLAACPLFGPETAATRRLADSSPYSQKMRASSVAPHVFTISAAVIGMEGPSRISSGPSA